MFICIAGKNKCAVDAVRFLFSKNFKKKNILILPNNDDDGKDSWQPSLKGIANPVELYRVLGDKGAESRFEATYADHLTPVIGRDSEIALQLDRWQRAKDGEGQAILLSGEPGIGKSRLIHMLREELAEETYTPIRYQCSTHHTNSALYPVIDQLERAAGFIRGDDNNAKLDKIESLLGKSSSNVGQVVHLFATLLSLSAEYFASLN